MEILSSSLNPVPESVNLGPAAIDHPLELQTSPHPEYGPDIFYLLRNISLIHAISKGHEDGQMNFHYDGRLSRQLLEMLHFNQKATTPEAYLECIFDDSDLSLLKEDKWLRCRTKLLSENLDDLFEMSLYSVTSKSQDDSILRSVCASTLQAEQTANRIADDRITVLHYYLFRYPITKGVYVDVTIEDITNPEVRRETLSISTSSYPEIFKGLCDIESFLIPVDSKPLYHLKRSEYWNSVKSGIKYLHLPDEKEKEEYLLELPDLSFLMFDEDD